MAGAPCLAARAAIRGGAGLVKTAVPEKIWPIAATKLDESLTAGLPCDRSGALSARASSTILDLSQWADVVVLGPGLGTAKGTVKAIHQTVPRMNKALVLDADGLNAFSHPHFKTLKKKNSNRGYGPLVLTPHPGEMARLLGQTVNEIQKNRTEAVLACAAQTGAVVILKGHETLVAEERKIFKNKTGNPGMASGGTGDVLAGLLGALIGQGLGGFEAACLAVDLHGLAGDLGLRDIGPWSLSAGDLVDYLPKAFLVRSKGKGF